MAQKKRKKGIKFTGRRDGKLASPEIQTLAAELQRDRVARGLTWPAYAVWLEEKQSTVYKIAMGATFRPHELTISRIQKKLKDNPLPATT